jgi:predicted Zn-dependent peptidase
VKEFMLKKANENKAENTYWLSVINELNFTGLNMDADYEASLKKVTPEDIKAYAAFIFNQGNVIEVIMNPIK